MIKKYEKQDPPSWHRKLILVVGMLFGATILLFMAWAVMLYIGRV